MQRTLSELLSDLSVVEIDGSRELVITGVSYDSRTVQPGHLFLACDGLHTDGHDFIDQAIAQGAIAIVQSRGLTQSREGVTSIRVESPRRSIAPIAAAFFGNPSRRTRVIGITGTNGKSTTAFYTTQLLTAIGKRAGLLSTTFLKTGSTFDRNPYRASTPEAVEVQSVIKEIADQGNEFAVVEATSHGLSERNNRLGSISFEAGVFTNLSHEHLEFHGSFAQYRDDKANLFRFLDQSAADRPFGVVNAGTPESHYFASVTGVPVFSYGVSVEADLQAEAVETGLAQATFDLSFRDRSGILRRLPAQIGCPGTSYSVENALAALLVVQRITGCEIEELVQMLPRLDGVPGRFQAIETGQPFQVIVDFAHSPDAFERLLPFVRRETQGRLIVVFGSAGERDTAKRAVQGRIADSHADCIILTDEDPRGEPPEQILEEIAAGCVGHRRGEDLFLVPDRREAIHKACSQARRGDTVLLLGKGHEQSIEYESRSITWDEAAQAAQALRALGYQ